MARYGLSVCLCAALVATAARSAPPADDNALMASLAVQTAVQQGREHLLQNRPRAAVDVLEAQIARINGNQTYLMLLRDAYRAYIRELRVGKQDATAQTYLRRLQILEPGAVVEDVAPLPAAGERTGPALMSPLTRGILAFGPLKGPNLVARGKQAEADDPFQGSAQALPRPSRELRARAEQAFQRNHYSEAGALFAQAQAHEPSLP